MELLFYALIAVGGLIALFLIFKFLGGCIVKLLLGAVVLAVIVFLVYFLIRC